MPSVSTLPDPVLVDVVEALRYSLGRVTDEEMVGTAEAKDWKQVRAWVEAADAALKPEARAAGSVVPEFPISGARLRGLQRAMDKAEQHQSVCTKRAARGKRTRLANVPPLSPFREQLHRTLAELRRTSVGLMGIATVTISLNVAYLVFVDRHHEGGVVAGLDVLLAVLTLLLWVEHRRRLTHADQELVESRIPNDVR